MSPAAIALHRTLIRAAKTAIDAWEKWLNASTKG